MRRFFISCDQAQVYSTRDQYNDLSPKDRFRYNLHHAHCVKCRKFKKNNQQLSHTINRLKWVHLTDDQKKQIKHRIKALLKK